MTNEQYLLVRGWKRSGSFAGDGGDQWYDAFDVKFTTILELINKRDPLHIETAIEIQLNRDAEIRDFIDLWRPKPHYDR